MSSISDKDLDKLFQDAAENYKSSFDEDAWSAMRSKLDSGWSSLSYFKSIGGIIFVYIIGLFLIWWYTPENGRSSYTNAGISSSSVVVNPGESFQKPADNYNENSLFPGVQHGNQLEGQVKTSQPGKKEDHFAEEESSPAAPQRSRSFAMQAEDNPIATDESQKRIVKVSNHKASSPDASILRKAGSTVSPISTQQDPEFLTTKTFIEYKHSLPTGKLEKVEEAQVQNTELSGRFAAKLIYAPDLSSVGYFKPDRPGSNFGLIAEIFIGNRWSISTGALYARKIYFTEEEQTGYYGNTGSSSKINGECRVIDIPLNISYYIKKSVKHNLFLSVGSSSYLMLSERYDYLTVDNGYEHEWSQELKRENNHYFGLLNLSIGYERKIHKNIFIQLEPFLKAPLTGIGEGKIDLVSTGAFLNIKYHFNQ